MKTYLATCFLEPSPPTSRNKSTMARVFAKAISQDEALAKIKSQAGKEGYVVKKLETLGVLENYTGLGVEEGARKASDSFVHIEPFERGFI